MVYVKSRKFRSRQEAIEYFAWRISYQQAMINKEVERLRQLEVMLEHNKRELEKEQARRK